MFIIFINLKVILIILNVISKQKYYQFDNVNGVAVNLSGYSKYPINVKKKKENSLRWCHVLILN